jgi:hypothetical protein
MHSRRNFVQDSTQGNRLMQFARFVGTFGFVLALVVAGFAVGCGSEQGSTGVTKEDGKTIKEQRKQNFQQLKEDRKGAGGGKPKRGRDR